MTPTERRVFPRIEREISFYCYIDGNRFDTVSVDVSSAGVFLKTKDDIRPSAVVMVVPKEESARLFPVMLIGKIVRRVETPEMCGYGVRWIRCITRRGINSIYAFISSNPEFSQLTLPMPEADAMGSSVVGYDFINNQFFVPDIPGFGAPLPEQSDEPDFEIPKPVSPPPIATLRREISEATETLHFEYRKTKEEGALTQALRVQHEQVPVNIPVRVDTNDITIKAVVRMVSLNTIYATTNDRRESLGTNAKVWMPIPLQKGQVMVRLVCSVESLSPHPQVAGNGFHLAIIAIDHEERKGVFERYVKYRYYKMLTD
jgi:hypothetical protein